MTTVLPGHFRKQSRQTDVYVLCKSWGRVRLCVYRLCVCAYVCVRVAGCVTIERESKRKEMKGMVRWSVKERGESDIERRTNNLIHDHKGVSQW